MYPQINVSQRIAGKFSVEIRPEEDVADWETWYKGSDGDELKRWVNTALSTYPTYRLFIQGNEIPLSGYVFQIRTDTDVRRFFKTKTDVKNPFYNRKVYQSSNPGSVVSFQAINIDED